MDRETLYDGMTGIRDDFVLQAGKPRRPAWQRWGAAAAALLMAAGLGLGGARLHYMAQHGSGFGAGAPQPGMNGAAPGEDVDGAAPSEEGHPFLYYAGPVMPLDVLEGGEGLEAARQLELDFSGAAQRWHRGAAVTDRYVLKNTGAEDRAVTLCYPYAGTLAVEPPRLEIDGAQAQTELYAGIYSGGFTGVMTPEGEDGTTYNLKGLDSWEDYRALLEDGSYREEALGKAPALEQPVTVYEFTDFVTPEGEDGAPTLAMEFFVEEEKTQVLTYGMNGASWDEETGWQSRSVFANPHGRGNGRTLVLFLGEDVGEYQIRGYTDGGCKVPLDGVSASVTRYEATLGEVVEQLCQAYLAEYDGAEALRVPEQLYRESVARLMERFGPTAGLVMDRYQDGRLDDILSETLLQERVLYQVAQATIPAGGSVVVEAVYTKGPSYDFYTGGDTDATLEGYDLVTALGSGLAFSEQRVELLGREGIELAYSDLGFDTEQGEWEVLLAPEKEHYSLEVRLPQEE